MQNNARLCCSTLSFSPACRSSTWSTAALAGHSFAVRVCLCAGKSRCTKDVHVAQPGRSSTVHSCAHGKRIVNQGLRACKHITLCRGQKGQTILVLNLTSITRGTAC